MTLSIIIFGGLMLLAGVLLIIKPDIIFNMLRDNLHNSVIQIIAVLVRLIIGILLVTQSSVSSFPIAIEVLGWIFIVAGLFLAVIGPKRFRGLLSWVVENMKSFGRPAGLIAVLFGGFIIHAFV